MHVVAMLILGAIAALGCAAAESTTVGTTTTATPADPSSDPGRGGECAAIRLFQLKILNATQVLGLPPSAEIDKLRAELRTTGFNVAKAAPPLARPSRVIVDDLMVRLGTADDTTSSPSTVPPATSRPADFSAATQRLNAYSDANCSKS